MYVSLEDDLSDHSRIGRGRHPLPPVRPSRPPPRRGASAGVSRSSSTTTGTGRIPRAWWVLTAAGLPDVRILDGGLAAWSAAGGALQPGEVVTRARDITVAHHDLYAGARSVPPRAGSEGVGWLLDARAPERFRGEVELVDLAAGHIPGARNLPSTSLIGADGAFLPDAGLEGRSSAGRYRHGDGGLLQARVSPRRWCSPR